MVSEDFIIEFFEEATKSLDRLVDPPTAEDPPSHHRSLADCRQRVLEIQRLVLLKTIQDYNQQQQQHGSIITVEEAQEYLSGLESIASKSTVTDAKTKMEDAARLALCRLVLYTETYWNEEATVPRELQKEGTLERTKLLDFIALCHTAIKLPTVQKFLADGSALFQVDPSLPSSRNSNALENEPTVNKFPQARLELIQRHISRAIGWDPEFTSHELRRLFFLQGESSEYAKDTEIASRFHRLIVDMSAAITMASLYTSTGELSDLAEGGVTRVVSVQCSEVSLPVDTLSDDEARSPFGIAAPTRMTIDSQLSEEEQKRQIRLASEAMKLQQEIAEELLSMTEDQRKLQLDEAKRVSDEFLKKTMALPPGRERIAHLQSVDPRTSRLLAIHKLWPSVQANSTST